MIKKEELKEAQPGYKIKDGASITFDFIQAAIEQKAAENCIPVAFKKEIIQSGGFLNRQETPCLVLYHPDHPNDYFKRCLTIRTQGLFAYVSIFYYGTSLLTRKMNAKEFKKNSGSLGGMLASSLMKVDSSAFDAEYDYYEAIKDILCEAFS